MISSLGENLPHKDEPVITAKGGVFLKLPNKNSLMYGGFLSPMQAHSLPGF